MNISAGPYASTVMYAWSTLCCQGCHIRGHREYNIDGSRVDCAAVRPVHRLVFMTEIVSIGCALLYRGINRYAC